MTKIRALTRSDIPRLTAINATFTSDAELHLERHCVGLDEIAWRLTCRPLAQPFDRGTQYDLRQDELVAIEERLQAGSCLQLVATDRDRLVGLLEVEAGSWRDAGWIRNILIDVHHRRRGLGRRFIASGVEWAQGRGLKALVAETQTNNVPACHFYQRLGFAPGGVDDHFYRYCGDPRAAQDVAIFWYLEVGAPARGGLTTPRATGKGA